MTPFPAHGTPPDAPRRVAVVHEWLLERAGSERVTEAILQRYPQAELFTLIDRLPEADRAMLGGRTPRTSFLQRLPGLPGTLKFAVPLMPLAIEQFDLSGFDLVISSSHTVAKGVIVSPDALHLCYCHSPMRYAWDLQPTYLQTEGLDRGLKGLAARVMLHRMRLWDHRSAAGVDAFRRLPDRRLVVIGTGPDARRLQAGAPSNVRFAGHLPLDAMRETVVRAGAFLFAAVEDFGISPVEAMGLGTPVIALRQGGAAETVLGLDDDGPTGVFFDEQSPQAIVDAIGRFEQSGSRIDARACIARARGYSHEVFARRFGDWVDGHWAQWRRRLDADAVLGPRVAADPPAAAA